VDRSPGPAAAFLVEGGYLGFRIEEDQVPRLFANHQGGFRVFCPECNAALAGPFSQVWSKDRDPRARVGCPGCGREVSCIELRFSPAATFGKRAAVLVDAGSSRINLETVANILPGAVVVGSRR
jgi:hypothetical protein